ncbi:MAG: hypothetical protein GWP91_01090 [Rhodobacterales bacterium]|nr:hypothetical protein [Rhodobacterales bacterium]
MSLSLLVCVQAMAADSVALPAGEDPSLWRAPLALADLEWSGTEARVRIDVVDGSWWVHLNGSSRSATVPIPRTRAQREEVAFLARGLVRATGQLDAAVPTSGATLPPPPPPIPPQARPIPARPSSPTPEVLPESVFRVAPEVAEEPVAVVPDLPAGPVPAVVTSLAPVADGSLDHDRLVTSTKNFESPRLYAPAMRISFDGSGRPDAGAAVSAGFGFDVVQSGRFALGVDLSWQSSRTLDLGLFRGVQSLDAHLSALFSVNGFWAAGPTVGTAYRLYRQQFVTVEEGAMLVLGVENQLALLRTGRFALSWDQYARVDQGSVNLIRPNGSVSSTSNVEFGTGISLRYGGTRDPFSPANTLTD